MELHSGYIGNSSHREACQTILAHLFGRDKVEIGFDRVVSDSFSLRNSIEHTVGQMMSKNKVLLVASD